MDDSSRMEVVGALLSSRMEEPKWEVPIPFKKYSNDLLINMHFNFQE